MKSFSTVISPTIPSCPACFKSKQCASLPNCWAKTNLLLLRGNTSTSKAWARPVSAVPMCPATGSKSKWSSSPKPIGNSHLKLKFPTLQAPPATVRSPLRSVLCPLPKPCLSFSTQLTAVLNSNSTRNRPKRSCPTVILSCSLIMC